MLEFLKSLFSSLGFNEGLKKAHEELESRVRERTAELLEINRRLRDEISEHQRSEERFYLVVESAPNAIVITDQSGEITLINSQAENVFGYTRQELVGKPIE